MDSSRIIAPIRYAAWLAGDLGMALSTHLEHALGGLSGARVTRLPRGFLIEANESPGPMLEAVAAAMMDLENGASEAYPIFHAEMGPVWTGTLQAVLR